MRLPRIWSSNPTFVGGAHAGEATTVDPGAAITGNGFYPDLGFAAEHANFQLNAMTEAERDAFAVRALRFRTIQQFGDTLDSGRLAVAAITSGVNLVLATDNTAGVLGVDDSDLYTTLGAFADIFVGGAVGTASGERLSIASNGTRLVAVGGGGGLGFLRADHSDDGGATWVTGGTDLANALAVWALWDPDAALFVVQASGNAVFTDANGTGTWTTAAGATNVLSEGRMALAGGGRAVAVSTATPTAFRTTDDQVTWATASGTVANAADIASAADRGCVAGAGTGVIYHVGRRTTTGGLQISSSLDGDTWTTLTELSLADAGVSDFSSPKILMCPDTGALYLVSSANSTTLTVVYVSFDGADWLGPTVLRAAGGEYAPRSFSAAAGRLFVLNAGLFQLMATDGIGF